VESLSQNHFESEPPEPDIYGQLLNGAGNHELKLLTLALMASQPDRWFGKMDLYRELRSRAEAGHAMWFPNKGIPSSYCSESLEPIGAVVKGLVDRGEGKAIAAFHVSNRGETYGLSLAGGLLDWSLRHEDHSLIELLGQSSSKNTVRAPQTRFTALKALLAHDGLTLGELSSVLKSEGIDTHPEYDIKRLQGQGILAVKTSHAGFIASYRLLSADFKHDTYDLEDTLPETQAIYKALSALEVSNRRTITNDEIIALAIELSPDVNLPHLRKTLNRASSSRSFPGLELEERTIRDPHKRSELSVNATHREAIRELVEVIDQVISRQRTAEFEAKARHVLSDPLAFATLVNKVARSNPKVAHAKENLRAIEDSLLQNVRRVGTLTVRQATAGMASEHVNVSEQTVRRALGRLVAQGVLDMQKGRPDPSRTREFWLYRPKADGE